MKWLLLTVSAMAVLTVDSRGFKSGHKEHKLDNPTLGPDSPRPHYKLKKILPDGLNLVKQTGVLKAAQVMVHYGPRDQELPEVAHQTEKGHLNMSNFQRSDLEENKRQRNTVEESRTCGIVNRGTKIVGGIATKENEYPWQVALLHIYKNGHTKLYCGGSLINDRWVLTAAHCIVNGWTHVTFGNHDITKAATQGLRRNRRDVRIHIHPEYNQRIYLDNDFALLELSVPLVAPGIRPVCLPSAMTNPSDYEDVDVVATGWGRTSTDGRPKLLQEVQLITMNNFDCNDGYGEQIFNSMICAINPGKGTCYGDSGGPLVMDVDGSFQLVGVSSFVSGNGCADPYEASVFARVTKAIGWIHSCTSFGECLFENQVE